MSARQANDSATQSPCPWPGRPGAPTETEKILGLSKPMKMPSKIIEDAPVNRSVAMLPQLGLITPPKVGLLSKPSMGLPMKPVMGIPSKTCIGQPSRPSTNLNTKPAVGLPWKPPMERHSQSKHQDFIIPSNDMWAAKPSNWKVLDSSLSCVPEHYFLERTHRFISSTPATVVSTRISDCLRDCSIEAKFDNAKAKAICKNKSMDKYRINLFRGRGDYKHGVIVEVQRRTGSSVTFMRDCRIILDAADGEVFDDKPSCEMPPVPEKLKRENIVCPMSDSTIAIRLFENHGIETRILGAELLCFSTDCTKTDLKTAIAATRNILDEKSSAFNVITTVIEDYECLQNENESYEKLFFLSLQLLNNLVSIARRHSILHDIMINYSWFTETFIPILFDVMKNCYSKLQVATIATKTLNSLASASDEFSSKVKELEKSCMFIDVSKNAPYHHAEFAQECSHFKRICRR
eukprot:CAMPEP_0172506726 /NCGR_PEP_ID=MMETSP1066-20121228/197688_1 /TAXON_ID=671091 /ORGANISM="Coscinodiscus wailesii, Strain CCMP2513" /LENGTH=462 /DNA_ID=CAMNT_0013283887 /DNA_START=147 /DNA_END=1535 /DNA_ORIENTATION=-